MCYNDVVGAGGIEPSDLRLSVSALPLGDAPNYAGLSRLSSFESRCRSSRTLLTLRYDLHKNDISSTSIVPGARVELAITAIASL